MTDTPTREQQLEAALCDSTKRERNLAIMVRRLLAHPGNPSTAAKAKDMLKRFGLEGDGILRAPELPYPATPPPSACERCGELVNEHCRYELRGMPCVNRRETCHAASYSCKPVLLSAEPLLVHAFFPAPDGSCRVIVPTEAERHKVCGQPPERHRSSR